MLQLIYYYRTNDRYLVRNFKVFSDKMKKSFNNKLNIWNIFDKGDEEKANSVDE